MGAPKVFISYRRQNAAGYAGRLYDSLSSALPRSSEIFMDIDSLRAGLDFEEQIAVTISQCDAVLVLLGPGWSSVADERGQQRLAKPDDLVRREVEAALERDVLVVPVLLSGADMPLADELPASVRELHSRHALELSDTHWRTDIARLVATIEGRAPSSMELTSAAKRRRLRGTAVAAISAAVVIVAVVAVLLVAFAIRAPRATTRRVPSHQRPSKRNHREVTRARRPPCRPQLLSQN